MVRQAHHDVVGASSDKSRRQEIWPWTIDHELSPPNRKIDPPHQIPPEARSQKPEAIGKKHFLIFFCNKLK